MVTIVVVVLMVAVAVVIGFVVMAGRRPGALERRANDPEDGVVSEPVPIVLSMPARAANRYRADDVTVVSDDPIQAVVPSASRPDVRWTKQFEPRSGTLSDQSRLGLINDLGMLGAPWCIPLLAAACDQEPDPAHRVAAQLALARCVEGAPSGDVRAASHTCSGRCPSIDEV
jgi:hypothetical protein